MDLRELLRELSASGYGDTCQSELAGRSNETAFSAVSFAKQDPMPLSSLHLRESLERLRDQHDALEIAAREEISELRARLQEAHLRLADSCAEQLVLGHSFQSHRATSSKDAPRRREPPRRILGELLCTGFEDFLGRCVCAWRCVAVSAARHRQEF
ncbi:unnamed protein product, partial [Polarella glacialis]